MLLLLLLLQIDAIPCDYYDATYNITNTDYIIGDSEWDGTVGSRAIPIDEQLTTTYYLLGNDYVLQFALEVSNTVQVNLELAGM